MSPPSSSPSLHPHRSHLFTPIQEGNESEETEMERHRFGGSSSSATSAITDTSSTHHHQQTPLHEPGKKPTKPPRRRTPPSEKPTTTATKTTSVLCNDCRPTPKQHSVVTVVPLHSLSSTSPSPSPTGLFKSLLSNISSKRSTPKPSPSPSPGPSPLLIEQSSSSSTTISDLSHKLIHATRKRDEAILEASRLKYTMAELEKKLNRLEVYCHSLKTGLDMCHNNNNNNNVNVGLKSSSNPVGIVNRVESNVNNNPCDGVVVKSFLGSVSDARSSIRFLSRALTSQLKLMGIKVFERVCTILRSHDIKLPSSFYYNNNNSNGCGSGGNSNNNSSRVLQFYLEALLSVTFYEDFETAGFLKNSVHKVLYPMDRAESSFEAYKDLKDLAWEEVLSKGTKHFSEEFSRFCDRKMSEIVSMLGWNRAWPEQLLQAFFRASKSVWLVHLLANSVHPSLTIFRVDKGVVFDPVYMEDMGGDKAKKLIPTVVRIMVAPGFYVYDNVVKCKVLCRYYDSNYSDFSANDV